MTDPQPPQDNATPPPAQPQPPVAGPGPAGAVMDAQGRCLPESPDAKTMGMLAHLLVIFTGFVGPLIIWLVKKDQSPFVNQQGKEALNWAITVTGVILGLMVLAFIIAFIMPCFVIVIWLAMMGVSVCNIVFGILSTIQVNKGKPYRYPFCIRLIS